MDLRRYRLLRKKIKRLKEVEAENYALADQVAGLQALMPDENRIAELEAAINSILEDEVLCDRMNPIRLDSLKALVAERPAPPPVPLYECIGKGGDYDLVASAFGAGTLKQEQCLMVYKNLEGIYFVRTHDDFFEHMQLKV